MGYLKALTIAINSIFGGQQAVWQFGKDDEFLFSLGIDPELELASLGKASGAIAPTRFRRFDDTDYLLSAPMWISGAMTSSGVYVYDAGGTVTTYSVAYAFADALTCIPYSAGNGMAIYNDYVYCASESTIHRGGRLSATAPTFMNYWIDGLTMSSLSEPSYPSTRNVTYPSHVLFPHNDGWLYVADYDGANGRLHALITDADGTNGRGEMDVLTLPPGFMPMGIASYDTNLAVVASPVAEFASGSIPSSQNAIMVLWDTVRGNKFFNTVDIGEPMATGIKNKNGILYVTAGNVDAGMKLLRYLGDDTFDVVAATEEGSPPPAGAIAVKGNMIAFGEWGAYPGTHSGVFAYGYRDGRLPESALNHIARTTATGTLPIVTALAFLERNNSPIMGWATDTPGEYGLDRIGGAGAYSSIWQSGVVNVGKPFTLKRITLPLSEPMAAGMQIEVDVVVDNEDSNYGDGQSGIRDITTTNFSSSEKFIDLDGLTIEGKNNFYLKLSFVGTTEVAVIFPITYEVEYLER